MKITIGGLHGSGKSTIAKLLAEKLNYKFVSGGGFYRDLASSKGMSVAELVEFSNLHPEDEIEKKCDQMQSDFGKQNDNFVLESHIGWFNVPDSFKIQLSADDEVRYRRMAERDDERIAEDKKDLETTKNESLERQKKHQASIFRIYKIGDMNDKKHFDLVVDTTKLSTEEVVSEILKQIHAG